MKKQFYLDAAASTSVKSQVIKEIQSALKNFYANPSSIHSLGEEAAKKLNEAREKIAKEINARPSEIYFTSGATESNNLAIQGIARQRKGNIIISAIEHPSVNEVCNNLQKWGYEVKKVSVSKDGIVNTSELASLIDKNTILVSIIHVNNVIGTVQDLQKIGEICRMNNVPLHTDAVQSFGKIKIDVEKMGVDLLSASAHKLGGPKGIGLLYVRDRIQVSPVFYGGGQEKGIRSGTENVPLARGFAKALGLTKKENPDKLRQSRESLLSSLEKIGLVLNGPRENAINILNVSSPGVDGGVLVHALSRVGIYVSTGSACDSKKEKEDHVLKAIGVNKERTEGAIRISLQKPLTKSEISLITKEIEKAVKKLK